MKSKIKTMKITEQQNEKECINKLFNILEEKNASKVEYVDVEKLPDEFKIFDTKI